MGDSVDCFWLIPPIRYGLPGGAAMVVAFFSVYWSVARAKGLDAREMSFRIGYLGVLTGLFVVGWMVHFWGQTYVLLMFLLGAGAWFQDVGQRNRRAMRDVPIQPVEQEKDRTAEPDAKENGLILLSD